MSGGSSDTRLAPVWSLSSPAGPARVPLDHPMALRFQKDARTELRAHVERSYPTESCGFLLGFPVQSRGDPVEIEQALPARNLETELPRSRFQIDPRETLLVERRAAERGQVVHGFYHSHPDQSSRPSPRDELHAWPSYLQVIASVVRGNVTDARAYCLDPTTFRFHEIPTNLVGTTERRGPAGALVHG